jgi:hypothetical protein
MAIPDESKGRTATGMPSAQKKNITPSPFIPISDETLILGGSLLMFSLGMALGVRAMMKREKFMFGFRSEYVGLATKALMYGTALSVGTFGVSTVLFMQATGIRSPKELGDMFRGKLSEVESIKPAPDLAKDIEEKSKMSTDEEMAYWNNLLFRPRTAQEKAANDLELRSIQSKLDEKDKTGKLSFWDSHFNRPAEVGAEKRQSLWQKWTSTETGAGSEEGAATASADRKIATTAAASAQVSVVESDEELEQPVLLEEQARSSLWAKYMNKQQKK